MTACTAATHTRVFRPFAYVNDRTVGKDTTPRMASQHLCQTGLDTILVAWVVADMREDG